MINVYDCLSEKGTAACVLARLSLPQVEQTSMFA